MLFSGRLLVFTDICLLVLKPLSCKAVVHLSPSVNQHFHIQLLHFAVLLLYGFYSLLVILFIPLLNSFIPNRNVVTSTFPQYTHSLLSWIIVHHCVALSSLVCVSLGFCPPKPYPHAYPGGPTQPSNCSRAFAPSVFC